MTNIQRYSLNDGPGMRTTIFLKGCPLHCPWCHNPETQSFQPDIFFRPDQCMQCGICLEVCPNQAITLENKEERVIREQCCLCMACVNKCPHKALERIGLPHDEKQFLKEISSDTIFYRNSGGGITISGGEPLSFPDYVLDLLIKIKAMNIKTCIDTCGYADWMDVAPLIPYLDLVLFDIKCIDAELHQKHTGVSNEKILTNFVNLVKSGVKTRVRIPIIPGFNHHMQEIEKIADFIQEYPVEGVDILPYHRFGQVKYRLLNRPYEIKFERDLTKDDVRPYENIFKLRNIPTTIGG
ncbi:hypothetical protein DCMF_12045 [Candidatus Formimonas warabiya]|uniref:Glycyl-radical enzyme activating protein n=2 Tax=Formimonas warabiya TaxID=1761012 RepID=A0A3G1L1A8_FORW1|nr:hypothetical protein DCMF_12045 [Candidatus Formimonas warabiya]